MQRCGKTCTTVLHNQARMGDWQNMRPYILPGFYSEANVPLIFLLFAFGNQKKHARILWAQETGENGDRQNMPSLLPSWLLLRSSCASSLLAFCPTQLHAGVSGSVKSDQRHSALGPCWAQNWNWVRSVEIVPCHLYNFHSTATKWGTKLWHVPFWGWGMDQFISESFGMKWNVVKENVAHLNELNQNGSSCASQTNFGSST